LLVVRDQAAPFEDRTVGDLPALLRPGDEIVVNDKQVIPATLHGRRIGLTGAEPAPAAARARSRPIVGRRCEPGRDGSESGS
jgi:S-adenosylmethionine:tRNA ribosyltransferase-isomerase